MIIYRPWKYNNNTKKDQRTVISYTDAGGLNGLFIHCIGYDEEKKHWKIYFEWGGNNRLSTETLGVDSYFTISVKDIVDSENGKKKRVPMYPNFSPKVSDPTHVYPDYFYTQNWVTNNDLTPEGEKVWNRMNKIWHDSLEFITGEYLYRRPDCSYINGMSGNDDRRTPWVRDIPITNLKRIFSLHDVTWRESQTNLLGFGDWSFDPKFDAKIANGFKLKLNLKF